MKLELNRRHVLMGAAAMLAAPAIARAADYKSEYKLSIINTRPSPNAEASHRWADLVRERTGGKINIKVYEGSQLVGGVVAKELPSLRQGIIDFASTSTISATPNVPQFNLLSLPFLMPTSEAWDAVMEAVWPDFNTLMEAQGVVGLYWSENGFRQLCNTKLEVRKPADLSGLKIRYAAPIYGDIFTALGANPVQMNWGDTQSALGTKAIDGLETPLPFAIQNKLYTLGINNISVWNYATDANMFLVGKGVWDGFSKEDQEILKTAATEAGKWQTSEHRAYMKGGAVAELEKNNVKVAQLTADELKAFQDVTKPVTDKWAPQVGDDLVAKARAAVAKLG